MWIFVEAVMHIHHMPGTYIYSQLHTYVYRYSDVFFR